MRKIIRAVNQRIMRISRNKADFVVVALIRPILKSTLNYLIICQPIESTGVEQRNIPREATETSLQHPFSETSYIQIIRVPL